MQTTIPAATWINPTPPPKAETWALILPPILIVGMVAWAAMKAERPDHPAPLSALAAGPEEQEAAPEQSLLDLWAL